MFSVDLPARLVAAGTKAKTAASICFLEGPAWHASGDLYFSDISGNRILKMTPDGNVSVFRADSGRTNGNTFDAEGRLISCEGAEFGSGGRRRVVRSDVATGKVEVLTERYEGKRYNSPNDVQRLVFDFGRGRGGDGMRLDRQGNLWVAAGVLKPRHPHETAEVQTGIHVISPEGKLLGRIPIPEDVLTNRKRLTIPI